MGRSNSKGTSTNGSGGTVAAVVVTYNRKQLLARCLDAIFTQSRSVDHVILVDNCSTDGTPEFLEAEGYLCRPALEYVRLAENAGGAGGFYEGMKRAYEQGYDWLWTMDDDGLPHSDTLAMLLQCPSRFLFRGCLVISSDDPTGEEFAFAFSTGSGVTWKVSELRRLVGEAGIAEGHASPFNGVLISREVVRRVGLPKKELFIWGDEVEYLFRAKKADVPIGTVLAAKFSHPSGRARRKAVRFGFLSLLVRFTPDDPFRCYVMVRNTAYLRLRQYGPLSWRFLKLLAYPLLFPGRARLLTRALCDGMVGRFLSPEQARATATKLCR